MATQDNLMSFKTNSNSDFIGINALGILRKDLVAVLGMERAKGFLLRYSRQCGSNDAKYLRGKFDWDPEIELLHAGYRVNEIRGDAIVRPVNIRANRETGDFYFEGHFIYSCEAEKHIEHFGLHHEPVCYNLIGYAGGYASEYYKEEVIFKETKCIGKGDPFCVFIGKTIQDWGSEINDILPFYEEENLADELDRAYKRIEKQKKMLSDVQEINEKLSKSFIKNGQLSGILKILSQSLFCTVVLEDRNFNLIGSYGDYQHHDFVKYIQVKKTNRMPWVHTLFGEKRTVQLYIDEYFGWEHYRLISPVLLNNEVWGYISFVKQEGRYDEMEHALLERANTICALYFSIERTKIETEKRVKGSFLNELLTEKPNLKNLSYRMKLLGYDFNKGHYVFILDINYEMNLQEVNSLELENKILDEIDGQLQTFGGNCLVSIVQDQITFLIPKELTTDMEVEPKKLGELIVNPILKKYPNLKFNLGVSSLFMGIAMFRKAYDEAKKSILIANRKETFANVISFDELGYLGFLLDNNNTDDLERFAIKLLEDLIIYDKENNTELLRTLYYLLEYQGNILQTSRELIISDGAVRYRLKRIQEITKLDITKSKDFVNAHLAIQILLNLGLFEV